MYPTIPLPNESSLGDLSLTFHSLLEYYIIMTFTLQNHYNAQSTIMYKMITMYYIPPNDCNVLLKRRDC